ncbi:EAL domain-containing protein [Pseudoxanthomonas sp. SGD-10]|nr:EAL domain-containing protein [Pseudoxanthomonas sp. SGD-10]
MKLRMGLQARFLASMSLLLVVVLVLLGLVLQRQQAMRQESEELSRAAIHELIDAHLHARARTLAQQLATSLARPLQEGDTEAIAALLREQRQDGLVRYLQVADAHGRVVQEAGRADEGPFRVIEPPAGAPPVAEVVVRQDEDVLEAIAPVRRDGRRIGQVRVGLALEVAHRFEEQNLQRLRERADELARRQNAWVALLLGLLLAVVLGMAWYVQRVLVRPIRDLAASARRIEAGDYNVQVRASARNDELGELERAFNRMSESVARHDRDVRQIAYTDPLTGLTNRLAFREDLEQRLEQLYGSGRQLALLFADIDDFKRVNDTLGHEAGDEALLQFATRIREAVRRHGGPDARLARFGGDEFVILVEGEDVRPLATRLAGVLVAELRDPLQIEGRQVFLGTSIGITLFPEDATGASGLMKNGDIAMYQAKSAGKNGFRFYSRAMDHAVERRAHMEQELRGAWERGEVSVVYQPIGRTSDGRIVGAEALLRWQHPELGTISPAAFIDVAEQSGLIDQLGPRVLRQACIDAARWARECGGEPPFVSVNVSPRQLRHGELPGIVAQCLAESGLPAGCLHLELTETALISDELQAGALLTRLHATGVKVWLDDFGTGFSGLSHLRRVPVDGLKIDRSFIADMQRDPDDLALTSAIVAMAHSLGITVVAEGVEKQAQLDLLAGLGCDLVQGYWLSHPLGAEELAARLAARDA